MLFPRTKPIPMQVLSQSSDGSAQRNPPDCRGRSLVGCAPLTHPITAMMHWTPISCFPERSQFRDASSFPAIGWINTCAATHRIVQSRDWWVAAPCHSLPSTRSQGSRKIRARRASEGHAPARRHLNRRHSPRQGTWVRKRLCGRGKVVFGEESRKKGRSGEPVAIISDKGGSGVESRQFGLMPESGSSRFLGM